MFTSNVVKSVRRTLAMGVAIGALTVGAAQAETYEFVGLEFPPIITAASGQASGLAVELVTEAFKRMGHEQNMTVKPWARSLEDAKEGNADGIYTIYKNAERETFLDFSNEVVVPQQVGLFVAKESGHTAESLGFTGDPAVLGDKKVGIRLGISYGSIIDDMIKAGTLNTEDTNTDESNLRKLVAGRVDVVPGNVYVINAVAREAGLADQIMMLEPVVQDIPSYVAFSKARNHAGLRDQFDAAIKSMKDDGTYDAILNKYLN